jgi:hypothetical protein
MGYYYFIATRGAQTAITTDKNGANLPPCRLGRWQFIRELHLLDMVRGTTSTEIVRAIERDGYWLSLS